MKLFSGKYTKYIIELFLLIVSIAFTLLLTDLPKEIQFVHNYFNYILILIVAIWFILFTIKIKFENNINQLFDTIIELQIKNGNHKNENKRLIELLDTLKYQISGSWNEQLRTISNGLKFDNTYRITVYLRTHNKFISFARYSNNPEFSKFGRSYIDNNHEYIYKAWENGEGKTTIDIPDNTRKMKSKAIWVNYLYTKDKFNKIGIVVFETTDKSGKKLVKCKLNQATQQINKFINESLDIKPDIYIAMNEGL